MRTLRRQRAARRQRRVPRRLAPALTFRSGKVAVARLRDLRVAGPASEARITATFDARRAESNVIRALAAGETKTWWGDLHGQTRATVGTGTIEEYFEFGRDVGLLDMMCHQANDFQVTEEEWQRRRREIDRFHQDGRCVIFVGYEWSGMTPGGGDHNVMFRGDVASLHRSSHAEVDDMNDAATDCFDDDGPSICECSCAGSRREASPPSSRSSTSTTRRSLEVATPTGSAPLKKTARRRGRARFISGLTAIFPE